jgi:hypothetical protein
MMPIAIAGAEALTTVSPESISTAEEESTDRTSSAPGGTTGVGCSATVCCVLSLNLHRYVIMAPTTAPIAPAITRPALVSTR